jgi:hypothetical protein
MFEYHVSLDLNAIDSALFGVLSRHALAHALRAHSLTIVERHKRSHGSALLGPGHCRTPQVAIL